MTEQIILALIAAIPPTIVALLAFISSLRNARKLSSLSITIDGRLSQLLAAKDEAAEAKVAAAHAEGAAIERAKSAAARAARAEGVVQGQASAAITGPAAPAGP